MLRQIKITLWRIGLIQNCPICGADVVQIGHKKLWTVYVCSKCDFGKIKQEKYKPIIKKTGSDLSDLSDLATLKCTEK